MVIKKQDDMLMQNLTKEQYVYIRFKNITINQQKNVIKYNLFSLVA